MDAVYLLIKGELWFKVPETIKFNITGKLPSWCMGKDVILRIAGDYGTDVGLYKAAEITGPVIKDLSLAGRWTICNMDKVFSIWEKIAMKVHMYRVNAPEQVSIIMRMAINM